MFWLCLARYFLCVYFRSRTKTPFTINLLQHHVMLYYCITNCVSYRDLVAVYLIRELSALHYIIMIMAYSYNMRKLQFANYHLMQVMNSLAILLCISLIANFRYYIEKQPLTFIYTLYILFTQSSVVCLSADSLSSKLENEDLDICNLFTTV